eukprot:4247470-Prymnesium_polylepis.1
MVNEIWEAESFTVFDLMIAYWELHPITHMRKYSRRAALQNRPGTGFLVAARNAPRRAYTERVSAT